MLAGLLLSAFAMTAIVAIRYLAVSGGFAWLTARVRPGCWLITASHHQRHHSRYRCNYGLYFRFWDRLCGTDRGLGRFGTPPAGRLGGIAPAE